jgi:ATP-binding cassette subfamily B protein
VIKLLRRYLAPYRWSLTIILILVVIQSLANLYLPNLNADIINNGVIKGDTGYIARTGAFMLAVTGLLGVCAVVAAYFGARTAMALGRDVRDAVFTSVMGFSQRETNLFGTASLITRNTNDVQQVQMVLVMAFSVMIAAPIMCVGGIIMALREDVPLSGLLVVIIPLVLVVIGAMALFVMPLFRSMQKRTDRINAVMRETLSGIRVIRAFVRTDHEEARFEAANTDLTNVALRTNRVFAMMIPFLFIIMNLSSVAIVWFGGLRIDSRAMPIGNLAAFLQYVMQILFAVMMAAMMFILVPRAAAAAERINAVLDTQTEICDPVQPIEIAVPAGLVEFDRVSFGYPGAAEPVLRDISFTARPGQTTAIVGSTGSGKTSLINLIPRFYDVSEGSVRLDGVDVRDLRQEDLWSQVGLVPQKAYLFSGTVGSNLRYGRPAATDEDLWRALDIAQGRDFVSEMAGELDAPIDQGGTNVSGGQRQRLAIARAVVREPAVFIFDDSFSALDFRTDADLRRALAREITEATIIIVAQRVGTIMAADQIVVLETGAVVGIGTHTELMSSCPTYQEIVASQISPEEAS